VFYIKVSFILHIGMYTYICIFELAVVRYANTSILWRRPKQKCMCVWTVIFYLNIKAGLHVTTYCTFYWIRQIVSSKTERVYYKSYVLLNRSEIQNWIERLMGADSISVKLYNKLLRVNTGLMIIRIFVRFWFTYQFIFNEI